MTPDPPDAPLDTLADEAVEFALRHHPAASGRIRRRVARLYIHLRLNPSARTAANIGELLGEDRRRIPEIEASALSKLYLACRQRHPDLFDR
jgi:DNA-directed RNA polymerase sigma subunit (sigma70/sigma32)